MTPKESKRIWAKVEQLKKEKERILKEEDALCIGFKPEIAILETDIAARLRNFYERTGLAVTDILINYPFTNKVGGRTAYATPVVEIDVERPE